MDKREWLDREAKLMLNETPDMVRGAYQISKGGRPFVEYVQSKKDAFYLVNDHSLKEDGRDKSRDTEREKGKLVAYDKLFIDEEEASISPVYRKLVTMGIVSCPADATGPHIGEDLFEAVRDWLSQIVMVDSEAAKTVMAAYAMSTWFTFRYDAVPYLRFIGDFGTGKTTALKAMGSLCYRALNLSGVMTPASLFRLITAVQATLTIDEADLDISPISKDIVKILNHGYARGVAVVRMGNDRLPEAFEVFGPKVIATRKEFGDDALGSRCLDIRMRRFRGMVGMDDIEKLDAMDRAAYIRNGLLFLRFQNAQIKPDDSVFSIGSAKLTDGLAPRVRQIARPLFDFTPVSRQKEISDYFEVVNIGAESSMQGTEGELQRILQTASNNGHYTMQLTQIYQMLSYAARRRHTKKEVSRMLEVMGAERRHGREGTYVTFGGIGV